MGVVAIADWAMMYEDEADTLRGCKYTSILEPSRYTL